MRSLAAVFVLMIAALPAASQRAVYLDPSQPLDKRIDDLLSRLTLDEKASLMGTNAPAIERVRVPVMNGWNQCLHGVVWTRPTTMFPVPIGMAATWNPALVKNVASVIGDEARAVYNYWQTAQGDVSEEDRAQMTTNPNGDKIRHNGLVYRSPVINISRDPRWGRIDETFGEDPFLTSRMTVAFVKGMQGDHQRYLKIAATLKHYAVNNQEVDRHTINARVSERLLREYYLPHFKAGIVEARAQSVMTVYNALNGVPGAANHKLTGILRDDWGFDGFVVPDSGAVGNLVRTHKIVSTLEEAAARAVLAGHDLDNGELPTGVRGALKRGLLSESNVDRALRNVLRVRFRLGEFDPPEMVPYSRISPSIIASSQHRQLAHRAAQESIVLLRNEGGLLPLDKNGIKTIAVIGPHADYAMMGLGYTGLSTNFVKPVDGIRNHVAPGTQVVCVRGSGFLETDDEQRSLQEAAEAANKADVAVVFVGTNQLQEGEGRDRPNISLPMPQRRLIQRVLEANPKTVVVILSGGPVSLERGYRGPRRGAQTARIPAVLEMFYAGEEGGNAIAEVLFGEYNPGGRLPFTVYANERDIPPMTEYDITKGFTYMYFDGRTEYPFGHGLSYTTFEYSNLRFSEKQIPGTGAVVVSIDVQNTGRRPGDEVVQLYVRDIEASVNRPLKELRGFERISLKAGEKRTVSFELPAEKLAFFDEYADAFVTEAGVFEAMAGSSSADIRARGEFRVTSRGQWPK